MKKKAVNLEDELRTVHKEVQELQAANEKLKTANKELCCKEKPHPLQSQSREQLFDTAGRDQIEQLNQKIGLIDRYLHSSLKPEGIMRRTLSQASDAIGAETALVSMRQDRDWTVSHVHGLPKDLVGTRINNLDERHIMLAIESKKPVAIDNALADDRASRAHMEKWSVRSVLVVPMILKDEVAGVVLFNFHQSSIHFLPCHINFATQLSAKLSLALENARLVENLEREFAERKKAEEQLQRLNRTLKALSDSNLAMMRATSELQYLEEICKIVVQDCGHAMAWIGFAEDDEGRKIQPVAHAGLVGGYLQAIKASWGENERGYGPTGTSIREKKTCHCRNLRTDPNFAPWRNQAIILGYASALSVPLVDGQKVFGSLSIYSTQPNAFSDDEVRLLTEFGNNLSRGIADLRLRVAHARAQEALKELHETVGELEHFSYTITHDIRAPLRAMRGYGDLLLEKNSALDAESKHFITRINSAAGRMDNLITDALHYSKMVRQEFNLLPINCEKLLFEIINCYPQYQEFKSGIHIDGSIPMVLGNEAALTQCFSNLLNNAIKFVEPGKKPKVRIWAEKKGECVRIWFQDNGIGVPKENQELIFAMFHRLNPAYEGTGIGLALVRKAAERMSGKSGVESELGKGSSFWLELKRAQQKSK